METKQNKPTASFKAVRLASSAALGTLNDVYYKALASAKQDGKPVVWIASMTPIELIIPSIYSFFPKTTLRCFL